MAPGPHARNDIGWLPSPARPEPPNAREVTSLYQSMQSLNSDEGERWPIEPMLELASLLREQTAWTWLHSGRVGRYAVAFGKKLGLDRQSMMALQCAALLHDVGKTAVPPEVLDKTSELTRNEWYTITKHSMASSLMLKAQRLPRRAAAIAQSHHEWYDGNGYPLGLKGEAIPLGARVLSLADAYDAMNSDRPYRSALSPDRIGGEIIDGAGTQFDPALVRELMPLILKDPESVIPRRTLRVISDDQALFRQLWFAAYPLGWEIVAWPPAWWAAYREELPARHGEPGDSADLTVIDGTALRRVPEGTLESITGPLLWVDPVAPGENAVFRPLGLGDLLAYLDVDPDEMSGMTGKSRPVRVVLADPFQLFRQVLKRCLDERPEVHVVAEVRSPSEYRKITASANFDIAIVASDLIEGTRSTAPLRADDLRLANDETSAQANERPTIVLVADEDLDSTLLTWDNRESNGRRRRTFIHRGAPVEVLLDAMNRLLGGEAPQQNGAIDG